MRLQYYKKNCIFEPKFLRMRPFFHLLAVWICLGTLASCRPTIPPEPQPEPQAEETLSPDTLNVMERLEEKGMLVAVTNMGPLNYRLLDGRPAGFHFELLDDFSDFLGLDLNLSVNDNFNESLLLLKKGEVDIIAGTFDTLVADTDLLVIPIDPPVDIEKNFVWIILNQKSDTSFLSTIQLWLEDFQEGQMKKTFYRYFSGKNIRNDSAFRVTDQICRYDELIQAEAEKTGWDWRLLASIIFQESNFKPHLMSDMGAFGLMQLMPVTMKKYGIDYDSPVEAQLEAGIKVLNHFDRNLPETISDSLERINFILACYNAGMGHILEARHRAVKHDKDPDVWIDNVEYYVPKQTYFFVREITKRYSHYKNLIE